MKRSSVISDPIPSVSRQLFGATVAPAMGYASDVWTHALRAKHARFLKNTTPRRLSVTPRDPRRSSFHASRPLKALRELTTWSNHVREEGREEEQDAASSPNSSSTVVPSLPTGGGRLESRQLGLKQVYPPKDERGFGKVESEIDIVTIHGLNTRSPTTWEAWVNGDRDRGTVHWLRDEHMLPGAVRGARNFTYDWNANFDQGAAKKGLLGHADSLLLSLHIRKSKDDNINRPIIFIASCYGGPLLRRVRHFPAPQTIVFALGLKSQDTNWALHRASEAHNAYQGILKSIVQLAFLGTPFQGSHDSFLTASRIRLLVATSADMEPPGNFSSIWIRTTTAG
ncbi:hypothetical protein CDD83_9396 [Cordyceps sp. RAO-2017]|nr:hypothetical protein CDD83_9396 [Cordyceps sp. RAO-2017]